MNISAFKFFIIIFLVSSTQIMAQEENALGRFSLEGGIVGAASKDSCPGHYVSITGQVVGPLSLYGTVETFRCQNEAVNLIGSANRLGGSLLLGRSHWLLRPELRTGIEYDGGVVSYTYGASLAIGKKYGARLSLHIGTEASPEIVLFQLGGYFSF